MFFRRKQKRPLFRVAFLDVWLREPDLNRRPSGYEPDELPDCSIPRLCGGILQPNAEVSTLNPQSRQMSSILCALSCNALGGAQISQICRPRFGRVFFKRKQKRPLFRVAFLDVWLREPDLNRRPSGYEPDELPDCSIPRLCGGILQRDGGVSMASFKKMLFLQLVSGAA